MISLFTLEYYNIGYTVAYFKLKGRNHLFYFQVLRGRIVRLQCKRPLRTLQNYSRLLSITLTHPYLYVHRVGTSVHIFQATLIIIFFTLLEHNLEQIKQARVTEPFHLFHSTPIFSRTHFDFCSIAGVVWILESFGVSFSQLSNNPIIRVNFSILIRTDLTISFLFITCEQ